MLLYARVPGFYAEVERASDPALAQRPVIVGGDPRKRGLVQAATPDACEAGVEEGMAMLEALQRCPEARALPTDMRRYREASSNLRACFRAHVERVERAGLDAAYLASEGEEPLTEVADSLCEAVRHHFDWPLRVGIAPVRFLAKLAAEQAGVAAVLHVPPGDVHAFLDPQPVTCLPGVGPKTALRLGELGAHRVGDVVDLGREQLEAAFGNHGLSILAHAQGQDADTVRAAAHPRSLSQECTFPDPEIDLAQIRERLLDLARGIEASLARERMAAKRITLKLRFSDGEQTTRTETLRHAVSDAAELGERGLALLARTQAGTRPVKRLGLAVAALIRSRRDDRQLSLFRRAD